MVNCFLGAYQGVQVIYLVDPTKSNKVVGPVKLHIYSDTGNGKATLAYTTEGDLGVGNFDPKTTAPRWCSTRLAASATAGSSRSSSSSAPRSCRSRSARSSSATARAADRTRWPKLPTPTP